MLPKPRPARPALMLTLLPLLLSACASTPSSSPPVPGPVIPPLPTEARQPDLPQFSAKALSDIEQWQRRLTAPSSPASSASGPMTR